MKRVLFTLITLLGLSVIVSAQGSNKSFTIKNSKNLPAWLNTAEVSYMLDDNRLVKEVRYIGGHDPRLGDVFFINGAEVAFKVKQIKTNKNIISKLLTSGDFEIQINLDETFHDGAHHEGTITLLYKNNQQFKSKFYTDGW